MLESRLISVPDQRVTANVREKVDGRKGNNVSGVRGTARTRGQKSDLVEQSKPTLSGSV